MKILRQSHGIFCYPESHYEVNILKSYCKTLTQTEKVSKYSKFKPKSECYYTTTIMDSEFGFLRGCEKELLEYIAFSNGREPEIVDRPIKPGTAIEGEILEAWKPKEKQKPATDFLTLNALTRVIHADTGFGKTFIGNYTAVTRKQLTAYIMEPEHIETWVNALRAQTNIPAKEIVVVQGRGALKQVIELKAHDQLNYQIMLFSAPTLREFIKAYEESPFDLEFDVKPQDLMEYLGVGYLIRDEAHQALKELVRQSIYFHVPHVLYLSATLVDERAFIKRIYEMVFPKEDWWESTPNRHINALSLRYSLYDPKNKIKFSGTKGYSHVKYEQSIMANPSAFKDYQDLILATINTTYVKKYKDKLKCLVFFSTIDMCEKFHVLIKERFPDFSVGLYIQGSPESELQNKDIVVSTPKSAGTGKDVDNVSSNLMTVAVGSPKLFRQVMGRCRENKAYDDVDPTFIFFTNSSIPSHVKYEKKHFEFLPFRTKSAQKWNSGFILKAA